MNPVPSEDKWLHVNTFSNAVDSLERCRYFLNNQGDSFRWKWVAISLTDALYGLMILALSYGGRRDRVTSMKNGDRDRLKKLREADDPEYWEFRNRLVDSPRARLIPFSEALQMVRSRTSLILREPVAATEQEISNVDKLRKVFRDQFVHFRPKTWGIYQPDFVPLIEDTVAVAKKLMSGFGVMTSKKLLVERAMSHLDGIDRMVRTHKLTLGAKTSKTQSSGPIL
jgi:hypothetical protein